MSPGLQLQVLSRVALVDQRIELDLDLLGFPVNGALERGAIARRILGEAAGGEQHIQHRQTSAVGHRLRMLHLADDLHLARRAERLRHDNVDLRESGRIRKHLLDIPGQH